MHIYYVFSKLPINVYAFRLENAIFVELYVEQSSINWHDSSNFVGHGGKCRPEKVLLLETIRTA